ncbi:lipid-A-disaccharide synthase [Mangrovibrevibacter kandeliae]|uniref:lipid-A-disaccharide synthase n=1 Tax=Mangrovibrevibacter kandeliae TaxID=2968473 RepID=UPI002117F661|nr:lipid-A-disaccharide synthase [Aurantimonas sp. CSK15Z-1]MCQ8782577.1 lipid-A-disaccharide synthase [Aurantimonas sp. CSK15Z-1]
MRIAFITGEESGDRIGADLIQALRARLGDDLEITGLGGDAMREAGLASLFPIEELSIIGVGAILARLPQLARRLNQATAHVLQSAPDVLVVIDSPTFSHRVARRVRARRPGLPIVNYIPPTVWAWRPERAAAMRGYIDHALCAFPFEPEVLRALGGPPATYVGHPLMGVPALQRIMAASDEVPDPRSAEPPHLLLLPGSRSGEIARLIDDFGATLQLLAERLPGLRATLPTLPHRLDRIEAAISGWAVKPTVVTGEAAKWEAFGSADAALAASGTVSLELALAGVPMALAYRLDAVSYRLRHLMTGWTAALPNFIAGHPLVPEHFHEFVRAEHLARRMQRLLTDTPERRAQLAGFGEIREAMRVTRPAGDTAADVILDLARCGRRG